MLWVLANSDAKEAPLNYSEVTSFPVYSNTLALFSKTSSPSNPASISAGALGVGKPAITSGQTGIIL